MKAMAVHRIKKKGKSISVRDNSLSLAYPSITSSKALNQESKDTM